MSVAKPMRADNCVEVGNMISSLRFPAFADDGYESCDIAEEGEVGCNESRLEQLAVYMSSKQKLRNARCRNMKSPTRRNANSRS